MSDASGEHRCIFCWSPGEMTRELPMSKRVLDLAGFSLDDIHIEIDIPPSTRTRWSDPANAIELKTTALRAVASSSRAV